MTTATYSARDQKASHAAQQTETERRDWVRFPSDLDAICWFPNDGNKDPWGAVVRDISGGGVGIICRENPAMGTTMRIKLHSHYVNLSNSLDVKVVGVKALNATEYLIGCQFLRNLDENERRHLL